MPISAVAAGVGIASTVANDISGSSSSGSSSPITSTNSGLQAPSKLSAKDLMEQTNIGVTDGSAGGPTMTAQSANQNSPYGFAGRAKNLLTPDPYTLAQKYLTMGQP